MPVLISHLWTPSNSRTVIINGFIPVPRGTSTIPTSFLAWPNKDPKDVLDYQIDISPALQGDPEDTIDSADVEVSPNQPGDLSVDNTFSNGTKLVIWMSSGQAGVVYTVTAQISLASGRTLQRSILLPVVALSNSPSPVDSISTSESQALTDENNSPISQT